MMALVSSPSAITLILLTRLLLMVGGLSSAIARQQPEEAQTLTTVVCVTEEQCRQQFESMDTSGAFYVGDLTTKGCFRKGDNGFFGTGSTTDAEMATTDLPGVQERIWCDVSNLLVPPQEEELATLSPTHKPTSAETSKIPTFEVEAEAGEELESDSTTAPSSSFSPSSEAPTIQPPALSKTKAPTPLLTKKPTPILDHTKQPIPSKLDDMKTNSPSIISMSPSDASSTLLPTTTLSPSYSSTNNATTTTTTNTTTTTTTASQSPIAIVDQPSTAPTLKPSYEKAMPFSGPIQCKSLLASGDDEDIEPPTLDGIADEWTNITVYDLPLISASDPSKPFPYGNGAVQMQCVYDSEKVYFVFHVPGMYGEGEDHQNNAAISTMFKMGEEASLSNMGDCPNADDCTMALPSCESYKVDWQLLSSKTSSTVDDKYSVSLECRYDDDVDADDGGGNEWEGAWTHFNLTASGRTSSSREETSTTEDKNSTKVNLITMAEVRKRNMEDELWMVLENKVYDFTDFAPIHPGGSRYLTMYAGMDGTDPFQAVHFGVYARAETKEYYIGDLDMSSVDEWVFEMSRPLKTDSTKTDAQFVEGQSIDFGFSFWDPFETERGWTTSGYYTTGSTMDWTSIQFGEQTSSSDAEIYSTTTTITSARNSAASLTRSFLSCANFMLLLVLKTSWSIL